MFDQSPYICRFDWGLKGTRDAAERGDIIIIVDVLSFSTTTITAVHHGAWIYPYSNYEYGKFFAKQVGAEIVLGRIEAKNVGAHSLSPLSFTPEDKGKKYVLCSLNGATCAHLANKVTALFTGSFLNSSAVAEEAKKIHRESGANITVIACGEQWENAVEEENYLRPCIEDYLGAGSILAQIKESPSPEAEVCIKAFKGSRARLKELLWDCGSGRELRELGYGEDVTYSSQVDLYNTVPVLTGEHFQETKCQ